MDQELAPLLQPLVDRFYEKVRRDPVLGPVFDAIVDDGPEPLSRLAGFWSTIMLRTSDYKGNPGVVHRAHADRITPAMFERWLALWSEATAEVLPPPLASAMQERATRMARHLLTVIATGAASGVVESRQV